MTDALPIALGGGGLADRWPRPALWYYAASAGVLCLAFGLRFHDLPGNALWFDEAIAANNARGTWADVMTHTQQRNSSPLLYPFLLYAIQKIDSSPFSVRVASAAASVLTVAVVLWLWPRTGVPRRAAFLAAWLAALSGNAILHAQDAREYSLDALLAALMIGGLLAYVNQDKKGLLGVTLAIGPLLQYGLALFGIATLAAVGLVPRARRRGAPRAGDGETLKRLRQARARDWIRFLLVFLASGGVSFATALRFQWVAGGWANDTYLLDYYFQGSIRESGLAFAVSRTWLAWTYHMPESMAALAAAVFSVLLLVSLARLRLSPILILCLAGGAVAVAAALVRIYPLGDIRQALYLGPLFFLASGFALHALAAGVSAVAGQPWLAYACLGAAASVSALFGVEALGRANPYREREDINAVLTVLEEQAQAADPIFVTQGAAPAVRFYRPGPTASEHYVECSLEQAACIDDLIRRLPAGATRFWLVDSHTPPVDWTLWPLANGQVQVERVVNAAQARLWSVSAAGADGLPFRRAGRPPPVPYPYTPRSVVVQRPTFAAGAPQFAVPVTDYVVVPFTQYLEAAARVTVCGTRLGCLQLAGASHFFSAYMGHVSLVIDESPVLRCLRSQGDGLDRGSVLVFDNPRLMACDPRMANAHRLCPAPGTGAKAELLTLWNLGLIPDLVAPALADTWHSDLTQAVMSAPGCLCAAGFENGDIVAAATQSDNPWTTETATSITNFCMQ